MEEDVKPKDEDGVDGRGVFGWDGWVGGLGTVGASSIFGLVRRTGVFTGGIPSVSPSFVPQCPSLLLNRWDPWYLLSGVID